MKPDATLDALDDLVGTSAATALDRLGELGDGLPVGEPSPATLAAMIAATRRDANDTVVLVPPLRGPLTVRRLALCAALAGCEARHVPVVMAACEALTDPDLNAFGFLTTTGSAAPLILVNGPVARDLGFNGGPNCLGPGSRANATVGRALSLVVRIVGGARTGMADMATMGQPAKFTCCFAENDAASPWAPFHVDRGFAADDSTVTVAAVAGSVETYDPEATTPEQMVAAIATTLAGCAPVLDLGRRRIGGGEPLVLLTPEWAAQLGRAGLSKIDVQRRLHERASRELPDGQIVGVADDPERILVVVAGGVGIKQTVLPNWGGESRAVTTRVIVA